MVQVSMDGPNVNKSFLKSLQLAREEQELPRLIGIGSYGLHIIHGVFKAGAESTHWKLKQIFKSSFALLHDSPARRDDYISVSGCDVFPYHSVQFDGSKIRM